MNSRVATALFYADSHFHDGEQYMPYLIGMDVGTLGLRVSLFDTQGNKIAGHHIAFDTAFPKPSWVEQDPAQWWRAALTALSETVKSAKISAEKIVAVSYACTSCTVVFLDGNGEPVRPAMLWMDERSVKEARLITRTRHPVLKYSGGEVSPQWMLPKALWIEKNEPELFARTHTIAEQTDFFTHKLAGRWTASKNNATAKWNYDALAEKWPEDFIRKTGISRIVSKWPKEICPVGHSIGLLNKDVAEQIGLTPETLVVQGGIDAHAAMAGLGAINSGDISIVLGTSTCLMAQSKEPIFANVWGPYPEAMVPGMYTMGGGQTTTGAIIEWLIGLAGNLNDQEKAIQLQKMDSDLDAIPPGAEGLVALDFFQGNRNPDKDPNARGAIWGLSLRHNRHHIYRAFLEAVAYGVRKIIEDLKAHGFQLRRVLAGGGGAKSSLWMQIHSDILGSDIHLALEPECTALGAAIWAGLGSRLFKSYAEAINSMVRMGKIYKPNASNKATYDFYFDQYKNTYSALKPLMQTMASFQDRGAERKRFEEIK
jgi:FGGY-family pentulose kinase